MAAKREYRDLESRIGYRFRKTERLAEALLHRSYRFENEGVAMDNERLEFLGDAVLTFLAAAHIYERFADWREGDMTALRSRVISGKALAECARDVQLGTFLRIGMGEERSGGRERPSNLANALEAVIGAAYGDGGVKAVQKIFDKVIAPRLDAAATRTPASDNPKGWLQELVQSRWRSSPIYELVSKEGPAHQTQFTVKVSLPDGRTASGSGRSKQAAEAAAAADLLAILQTEAETPGGGA